MKYLSWLASLMILVLAASHPVMDKNVRSVGGSLLSVGSAAGVALMGQARGIYTFFAHLKWAWAIALGYAASIYAHILINGTG